MAVKFIIDSGADILPQECKKLNIIHLPLKVIFGQQEYNDAVMKMVLNFGMLENLCLFYNILIGKILKK